MIAKLDKSLNYLPLSYFFYSTWLFIGIIQAYFMPLQGDEAYYWLYSKHLDWGYFDHPPMIALWIKLGYYLMESTLGIRLVSVFAFTCSIYFAEKLIKPQNKKLFYAIISSIAVFHFINVLAIPDSPLLFFSLLFFICYKQFSHEKNFINATLLGLSMSCMLWSKYHGILIIFFTFIADFSLLKRKWVYWSIFISILFFSPHLYWQFEQGFPTIKYHLINRNESALMWKNVSDFIVGQLFVLLLFTGLFMLFLIYKQRYKSTFHKALKFNIYGFLLFFFLMSFRGKIEAHWTFSILFPLLILGYYEFENKLSWQNQLFRFLPFIISISILGRLIFSFPIDIIKIKQFNEHHHIGKITEFIMEKSGEKPVIFMNSYQKAALYSFHSGLNAYSLNNIMGRSNQFDIWNTEFLLQGKDVVLIPNYYCQHLPIFETKTGELQLDFINNFRSSGFVKISIRENIIKTNSNGIFHVNVDILSDSQILNGINSNSEFNTYFTCQIFDNSALIKEYKYLELLNENQTKYNFKFTAPDKVGKYKLHINLHNGYLPAGRNSSGVDLHVE